MKLKIDEGNGLGIMMVFSLALYFTLILCSEKDIVEHNYNKLCAKFAENKLHILKANPQLSLQDKILMELGKENRKHFLHQVGNITEKQQLIFSKYDRALDDVYTASKYEEHTSSRIKDFLY